jgi:hypothetical protein
LEERVAALVLKEENRPQRSVALITRHPLSPKVGANFSENGGHSVGIVRSRTEARELFFSFRQDDNIALPVMEARPRLVEL